MEREGFLPVFSGVSAGPGRAGVLSPGGDDARGGCGAPLPPDSATQGQANLSAMDASRYAVRCSDANGHTDRHPAANGNADRYAAGDQHADRYPDINADLLCHARSAWGVECGADRGQSLAAAPGWLS